MMMMELNKTMLAVDCDENDNEIKEPQMAD